MMLASSDGGMTSRIEVSIRSPRRAVSSMRVPVLARKCRLNWPASVVGKKSWPSQGISRKAAAQSARNTGTKTRRRRMQVSRASGDSAMRSRFKAALERALESRGDIPGLRLRGMMPVHLQQVHRERRDQGSRENVGREHREHHRFGQRNEQIARHAGQEEHRDEHDADAQRGNQRRQRDLRRAVQDAGVQILALIEIAIDVLDGDRGVVHQDADRQRQAAQRHDVDGFAQRAQHADGAQNRKRNGNRDDQRAAPAPEKQQDHDGGQAGGDDGLANHAADGRAHEQRLIGDGLDLQRRRKRGGDLAAAWPRTSLTISSVEVLPTFRMLSSALRWPLRRTMLVCGENPSRTCATSCT